MEKLLDRPGNLFFTAFTALFCQKLGDTHYFGRNSLFCQKWGETQ